MGRPINKRRWSRRHAAAAEPHTPCAADSDNVRRMRPGASYAPHSREQEHRKMMTPPVSVKGLLRGCFFVTKLLPTRIQNLPKPARVIVRGAATSLPSLSATTSADSSPGLIEDAKVRGTPILACPICYNPLINKNDPGLILPPPSGSNLECRTCKKAYLNNDTYLDLTVASACKDYTETMPAATELFRTPLVSFLYERGWRQNFVWGGFPGPEREFEMAKGYLKPSTGGTIIDASCGSGLFSRLFAKSGMFSRVIALDFSENMLQQCNDFIIQEGMSRENLILVRADISRLPFVSSSVDAVHAGAAMHCWPSPSAGVAEVSRVLRPGGVFVATTFILDLLPIGPILQTVRQFYIRASSNYLYLSEGELEDLCRTCGLVGFTCVRNGPFVMISANKPAS